MQEDDPAQLAHAREKQFKGEFYRYCQAHSPYADMYTLAARFALLKARLAEGDLSPEDYENAFWRKPEGAEPRAISGVTQPAYIPTGMFGLTNTLAGHIFG